MSYTEMLRQMPTHKYCRQSYRSNQARAMGPIDGSGDSAAMAACGKTRSARTNPIQKIAKAQGTRVFARE